MCEPFKSARPVNALKVKCLTLVRHFFVSRLLYCAYNSDKQQTLCNMRYYTLLQLSAGLIHPAHRFAANEAR